ncbi:MAG TPA: cupin domain-containing protein [Streptosporangiaceae bacterium]|jgi:mannose-6-phosphate isomerase-like protein (cupin superfamily)
MSEGSFDLSQVYVHFGLGGRAEMLPDFQWTADYLRRYEESHAPDGDDGRLAMIGPQNTTWDSWERHPAGDELVVVLSGRSELIQEVDGEQRHLDMEPGRAVINPRGVWHTVNVHEPGTALFITPGRGTQHRPR